MMQRTANEYAACERRICKRVLRGVLKMTSKPQHGNEAEGKNVSYR